DARVLASRDVGDIGAQAAKLGLDVAGGATDRSRDLDHRLHQLRPYALGELAVLDGGQHRVHVLDEVEALGVEEHVLLLDPEREGRRRAELVVENASALGKPLAGDGGRIDLLHEDRKLYSCSRRTPREDARLRLRLVGIGSGSHEGSGKMRIRRRNWIIKRIALGFAVAALVAPAAAQAKVD